MTKFKEKIDAIKIYIRIWLDGTIFKKTSLMTSISSLTSVRQSNEEMKPLWANGIERRLNENQQKI